MRASNDLMAVRGVVLAEMAALGWSCEEASRATALSYSQIVHCALKFSIPFRRKNQHEARPFTLADRKAGRAELIRRGAQEGKTRDEMSAQLGLSRFVVSRIAREHSIIFRNAHPVRAEANGASQARADEMASFYAQGLTLQQIAFRYGITRERVRQVLRDRTDLTSRDGGQAIKATRARQERRRRKELDCLDRNGCTLAERDEMKAVAAEMKVRGIGRYRTPLYAFKCQRSNAKHRGIEWKLSLWQWWQIWLKSGLWERRGRGQGYMMCRKGDIGPYAHNNVFIAPGYRNSSEGQKKTNGLPIGVRKNKRYAGYSASRMIHGIAHRLGSFATPEEAHAAYLAIGVKFGVAA